MKLIAIAIAIVGCIPFIGCYMTPLGTETEKEDEMRNWSASGTIDAANKPVSLQCNFVDAEMHTVQLETDLTDPTALGGGSTLVVVADITWRLGGNSAFRRVSLASGLQISGLAEAVQVSVYANEVPQTLFHVAILAGIGVRPQSVRPPTLCNGAQTVVGAGGAVTTPIPPGVGVISAQVLGYAIAADYSNVTVHFENTGFALGGYRLVDQNGNFVAIPAGATRMVINNGMGANGLPFVINWGIDG